MENASKALIIAGEVLIAVLILSVGAYIYSTFGEQTESYSKELTVQEVETFNKKFLQYIDENGNVTAQDVVTMINLAKSSKDIIVETVVDGVQGQNIKDEDILKNNIQGVSPNIYRIKEINYYTETDNNPFIIGAIKKIKIEKIP